MQRITVVTGTARSGTSLMMRMLINGGMDGFYDRAQSFETARMLDLESRNGDWLADCYGKCVKIIDPLIFRPPKKFEYDFLFMTRNPQESAKSQIKMLKSLTSLSIDGSNKTINRLSRSIASDALDSFKMMKRYKGSRVLRVSFERLITDTHKECESVCNFLGGSLDRSKMSSCVLPRGPECYEGLLEMQMAGLTPPVSERK